MLSWVAPALISSHLQKKSRKLNQQSAFYSAPHQRQRISILLEHTRIRVFDIDAPFKLDAVLHAHRSCNAVLALGFADPPHWASSRTRTPPELKIDEIAMHTERRWIHP